MILVTQICLSDWELARKRHLALQWGPFALTSPLSNCWLLVHLLSKTIQLTFCKKISKTVPSSWLNIESKTHAAALGILLAIYPICFKVDKYLFYNIKAISIQICVWWLFEQCFFLIAEKHWPVKMSIKLKFLTHFEMYIWVLL